MMYKTYTLFPVEVMQFKIDGITNQDVEDAISDIEFVIDRNTYVADPGVKFNSPKIQSKEVLFRDDHHWWREGEEKKPVWNKIRDSFVQAVNFYAETSSMIRTEKDMFDVSSAKAWFYRADKESISNNLNPKHNHFPAHVSGVFYLKNPGDVSKNGTTFYTPNALTTDVPVQLNGEELTWVLFPSWLYHSSSNDIQNEEDVRYIIAADAFITEG